MAVEQKPLMPKATAVWLVDNTALSFEQIADFCGLHPLEVKGIADEDVAKGIKGQDPVATGQLTREQIADAEKDPRKRLKMAPAKHKMPSVRLKRAPRYTPVSKRQDKPDAVYWLIRNHAEFSDSDIIKVIGTTKATIAKIRERSHWNAANIKAVDPVTLDRKSTRLNSSHTVISYAVFCLKKKKNGIKCNISTNRNQLNSGVDTCRHMNA